VFSDVDRLQAFMLSFPPMLTQRIKIQGTAADEAAFEIASNAILSGSVIALPTDTFYALAADPFNLRAVEQIFQIKGRQPWKPLLLLIDTVDHAESIAQRIPDIFYELAEEFWPGPLTIILPAAKHVPLKITGGTGTVGMRIPNCDLARDLVQAIDAPIVGTSANLSAHPPCSSAEEVLGQLGGKIELILDSGKLTATAPSTIIDLTKTPPVIVREGAIASNVLGKYLSR
jgi:L-threonylcarbamoyladenylate synthase